MTTPLDGGPVDQYLDAMFDRLAGTGANGRRLLAETEEHLAEAVAEARTQGLDADAAERQAVLRFGAMTAIVDQLPPAAGTLRISLRRLATITWALTGAAMLWYGLTGVIAWLLSWPWTRLLVATDKFGVHPMCDRPWIPSEPVDCFSFHRDQFGAVPWEGYPYPLVAVIGLFLLMTLLVLRRTTRIGAPAWTPARITAGLALAVPFGAVGLLLLFYGVVGVIVDVQDWTLSYLTAGLSAATISLVAVRRLRRHPFTSTTRAAGSAELQSS